MISLSTQMQKATAVDQAQSQMAKQHEEINLRSEVAVDSNVTDSLRRMIACRTGESLLVAFVIGGFLGWLTSKR